LIRIRRSRENGQSHVREAARFVDRDIKQVSANLERLEAYGVVEFVDEGRAKRPVVPYAEIDIRLPLREGVETDAVTA
jgi:predicted transcriptional regulator